MLTHASILSIFFSIGMIFTGKSQNNSKDSLNPFSVISLPRYYKDKGIIFNKEYSVGIVMGNFESRFTPTEADVASAEKVFDEKYNNLGKPNKGVKSFFFNWIRQYVGFIDSSGNKNIIIRLIDNSRPKRIDRLLGRNWENGFAIILSDEFYKVSKRVVLTP